MYTVPYLIRLVDRREVHRARRLDARHRFPVAWSGFRGGVSLAAALAVPIVTADGTPLPGRDLIIVVTFGVILVTLLLHGLTLPAVLVWSRLPEDHDEIAERRLADRAAVEAGLAALSEAAARIQASDHVSERVRDDLEGRLADLDEPPNASGEDVDLDESTDARSDRETYRRLRAELLPQERAAVVKLRDDHVIDDIVLRWMEARLDAEELRHTPPPEAE
jgi:monovalent cation/hydrogen antiporter